jgi:hypothetical protein
MCFLAHRAEAQTTSISATYSQTTVSGQYLDIKAVANGPYAAPVLILEKMDIENSKPIAETQEHYQDLVNELPPQTRPVVNTAPNSC